jgi:hypothetical protein
MTAKSPARARDNKQSLYSEAEVARHLAIPVAQLRDLVRHHILNRETDSSEPVTVFHARDLLLLRMLVGMPKNLPTD